MWRIFDDKRREDNCRTTTPARNPDSPGAHANGRTVGMRMFDEERPSIAGRKAFRGDLKCILPSWNITPVDEETVEITVLLPMSPTRFQPRWRRVEKSTLGWLLGEFMKDPEDFLREFFDWSEEEAKKEEKKGGEVKAPPRTDMDAGDLGF